MQKLVSLFSAKNLRRVTSSTTYVPQIDGLRFLAIIPVLIWHAELRGYRFYSGDHIPSSFEVKMMSWLPHGHIGVTLFFFISGYVIAFPFLTGRAPTLKEFYLRRLYRLEPPYILVLLLCFAALSLGHKPPHASSFAEKDMTLWQSLAASMVYMHGILFQSPPKLNPPTWSLELEIQFYLLSPFLLSAYLLIKNQKYRLIAGGACVVLAVILSAVVTAIFTHKGVLNWTIISHGYGFLLGIVACDYASKANPFSRATKRRFDLGFLIGCLSLTFSGAFEESGLGPAEEAVRDLIRAVAILLIYFGAARGPLARRLTGSNFAAVIGGMCYSIYLVHVPVMQAGMEIIYRLAKPHSLAAVWCWGALVLIPLGCLAGLVFFVFVERPCMVPRWPQKLLAKFS